MSATGWEQIPFATGINNLSESKLRTNLPFSIVAGTQQGLDHFENSIGNQDAISIIIEDNLLIAVVCDGCTNSNTDSVNEFTSNQVGANLLSKKAGSVIRRMAIEGGVAFIIRNLQNLQDYLLAFLRNVIFEMSDSETDTQLLINNFFTTTITIVLVSSTDYCIIAAGDGLLIVNRNYKELNFSGKYLSSCLENDQAELAFKIIETGKTQYLNSVFMASDGFDNAKVLSSIHFARYLEQYPLFEISGYYDGLPEFRQLFLTPFLNENDVFTQWPSDDASFIFIRRISAIPDAAEMPATDNAKSSIEIEGENKHEDKQIPSETNVGQPIKESKKKTRIRGTEKTSNKQKSKKSIKKNKK